MIDIEQDHQRKNDQHDLYAAAYRMGVFHLFQHAAHVFRAGLIFLRHACAHELFRIVGLDRLYGVIDGLVGLLRHPDAGGVDDQRQQHNPYDYRAPEAPLLIHAEHTAEVYKAQDAPRSQDKVRLHGEGLHAGEVRDQKLQPEEDRYREAQDARCLEQAVMLPPRMLVCRAGGICVSDRSPHGGHIHDPADGRSSKHRQQNGYGQDEKDGVARNAVFVEPSDPAGQHAVIGHGFEQPAQRDIVADQTGEDRAERRRAHDRRARMPQGVLRG